ncbi:MAG: hypothetical protein ACM3XO_15315 [Bacteroidota bacterium]
MSRRSVLILGLVALLLVTPAPIRAWRLDHLTLQRVPVPAVLRFMAGESLADLDGDGVPERLTLTQGRAAIWTGTQLRWQSPPAWQVTEGQITSLNRDGSPEVSLLVETFQALAGGCLAATWRPDRGFP